MGKTRDIAPGMRKTFDQSTADRLDDIHENNRDCPGQALKGNIDWSGMRDDHVGAQSYDLSDISTDALDVAPRPAKVDLDIAACAHGPAELPEIIKQRGNFSLRDRIVFKPRNHHADPSRPLGLLRACRERPRGRAAEQRQDLAPFPLTEMHPIPQGQNAPAGYRIAADRSAGRASRKPQDAFARPLG